MSLQTDQETEKEMHTEKRDNKHRLERDRELASKEWQENIASTLQVTVNFLFQLFQFFCNFFLFGGFFSLHLFQVCYA